MCEYNHNLYVKQLACVATSNRYKGLKYGPAYLVEIIEHLYTKTNFCIERSKHFPLEIISLFKNKQSPSINQITPLLHENPPQFILAPEVNLCDYHSGS